MSISSTWRNGTLPTARRPVAVRAWCGEADTRLVEQLFADTLVLGRPAEAPLAGFDAYRQLCLGWYLSAGRADVGLAEMHDDDGAAPRVSGYALVCRDGDAADHYARRATVRLAGGLARLGALGRLDRGSRDFYRARARDAATLLRHHRTPPAPVHAHVNVRDGERSGTTILALVAHIDERCRRAGEMRWYGEVNEKAGRRSRALERLGFEIVRTEHNHTLSNIVGDDVDRLTILRRVPEW